jgi:DNA primase
LNNPSEKLAYINGLAERLSRIRDPIERDTYLQAVARENGVDEKQLKKRTNELGISQDKNQEKEAVKEAFNEEKRAIRINSDGLYNAQKIILSLLCENNSLYKKICDYISPADFYEGPPRKLASHIFEMLGKQEKCSNATLINYFCDDVDSDSYAELLSFEIYGDHDENSEKLQLAQTVIKIMENRFRARISADADTSGQDISVTAEYINFMNNRAEIEKKIRN